MKSKDVRDSPATKLETSPGIDTDPFIITSFRVMESSPMGLVSLQYTFVKIVAGQRFAHIRTQSEAIILITFYMSIALYSL